MRPRSPSQAGLILVVLLTGCGPPQSCTKSEPVVSTAPTAKPEQSDKQEATTPPAHAERAERQTAKLGTISKLELGEQKPTTEAEVAEIRNLIAALAKIESPDFGLSATLSGDAFLPIEGTHSQGAFILMNHRLKSSPELRKLVELGPKSLPFLVDSLGDPNPTKLTIGPYPDHVAMWFDNELPVNPANENEQKVLSTNHRKGIPRSGDGLTHCYPVTVGDICFVAVGQIVGRPYQAVRYQPTACIVINSPTHDAELCRRVREIWSSDNAAQKLFDSLLMDYATEGVRHRRSLEDWPPGSDPQVGAAMRLLYYFPRESAPLIADRLHRLDVSAAKDSLHQDVANGVVASQLIRKVNWCDEPLIQAALLEVFKRATNLDALMAAAHSIGQDHQDLLRKRLTDAIDKLPDEERGSFGSGYALLVGLGMYGGVEAKPVFVRYLQQRYVQRLWTMCHVLREVRGEWSIELLAPLLTVRDEFGWEYAVAPNQDWPRLPIRVCDEAAETIAMNHPDLVFKMKGTHQNLDRQIEEIEKQLRHRRQ